jgi:hypothetical protein
MTTRDDARILHDLLANAGLDVCGEIVVDWYQATASLDPCPVCQVINAFLFQREVLLRQKIEDLQRLIRDAGLCAHGKESGCCLDCSRAGRFVDIAEV